MKNHSALIKIILVLVLASIIFVLNRYVDQASLTSSKTIGQIEALDSQNDNLRKLQEDYSKIEADVDSITKLLPSRRSINVFIDHINSLAKHNNAQLTLEFDENDKKATAKKAPAPKETPTIPIIAKVAGSRESVYGFFDSIEKSPYFIKVTSFEYAQGGEAGNTLTLTMEVYVDTINK